MLFDAGIWRTPRLVTRLRVGIGYLVEEYRSGALHVGVTVDFPAGGRSFLRIGVRSGRVWSPDPADAPSPTSRPALGCRPCFNEAAGVDPADARPRASYRRTSRRRFNEAAGVDPADACGLRPCTRPALTLQ